VPVWEANSSSSVAQQSKSCQAVSFWIFLDHTQTHTTLGRIPLDEWSARRRDLYQTTHNKRKRQISMPPVVFEPVIPASDRPQTHALDRAATEIGVRNKTPSSNRHTKLVLFKVVKSWTYELQHASVIVTVARQGPVPGTVISITGVTMKVLVFLLRRNTVRGGGGKDQCNI
jgi:hypothetical protein